MNALRLVQLTRHDPTPVHERRTDVTILDRFENPASVSRVAALSRFVLEDDSWLHHLAP